MPKASKSRKRRALGSVLSGVAMRTIGLRAGAAVVIAAGAAGLWVYHEHRVKTASLEERPAVVAVAPAKPTPTLAPTPPPAPAQDMASPTPEPPRRDASLDSHKPMSAALRAAFDSWLMGAYAKCWKAPKTTPDGDPYLPKVRVAFKEDGELAAPPKLVNPPSDPAWKPHADAALKAVKGCDPLHVPDKYADYYPSWKSRTVYFDPSAN
jgi:hypothetical protein